MPARDPGLTDGAVRLLALIRARAGADGVIERTTKRYLSAMLPGPAGERRSTRTIQRHLAALECCGYIRKTEVRHPGGATAGMRIEVTEAAEAFFRVKGGDSRVPHKDAGNNRDRPNLWISGEAASPIDRAGGAVRRSGGASPPDTPPG